MDLGSMLVCTLFVDSLSFSISFNIKLFSSFPSSSSIVPSFSFSDSLEFDCTEPLDELSSDSELDSPSFSIDSAKLCSLFPNLSSYFSCSSLYFDCFNKLDGETGDISMFLKGRSELEVFDNLLGSWILKFNLFSELEETEDGILSVLELLTS